VTPQKFKATVAKTGSRIFIPIPFNPNEVWGVKQRHHITGTVNGCKVRGSLPARGPQPQPRPGGQPLNDRDVLVERV
jgi:hypothetical protein